MKNIHLKIPKYLANIIIFIIIPIIFGYFIMLNKEIFIYIFKEAIKIYSGFFKSIYGIKVLQYWLIGFIPGIF